MAAQEYLLKIHSFCKCSCPLNVHHYAAFVIVINAQVSLFLAISIIIGFGGHQRGHRITTRHASIYLRALPHHWHWHDLIYNCRYTMIRSDLNIDLSTCLLIVYSTGLLNCCYNAGLADNIVVESSLAVFCIYWLAKPFSL